MIVSHNEILVTTQKALEACGFAQGDWEDAADSIAWLEQIGVSVLPLLCVAIDTLRPVQSGWTLTATAPNSFWLDANGGSCLQFGPLAADYALAHAEEHGYAIGALHGTEAGLWIGYLRHLARRGVHGYAVWQAGTAVHQYRFSAENPFPDYVCQQVEPAQADGVRIVLAQQPLPLAGDQPWTFSRDEPTPPVFLARVKSADFAAKQQQHLSNGIRIDDACWHKLRAVAKGILVEDTEESRARGAGGA